jgi:hypothetical protein
VIQVPKFKDFVFEYRLILKLGEFWYIVGYRNRMEYYGKNLGAEVEIDLLVKSQFYKMQHYLKKFVIKFAFLCVYSI